MSTLEYIQSVVKDRSFVDVGPVWVYDNEMISAASVYGASSLTAIDQLPLNHPYWELLQKRLNSLGVKNCQFLSMDVCQYKGPKYDVVYCAGVLYHHPSPLVLLGKLKQMCNSYLILGTVITDDPTLLPGSSVFLPGVPESHMPKIREDWKEFLRGAEGDIMSHPIGNWDVNNLYHWWWLFTKEAVFGMCKSVGFEIVGHHDGGKILTLLLNKIEPKIM